MLYSTLHKRWPRLVASVVGELIAAAALNLFIVPLGLYTGGMLGLCQLIRTLLQSALGLETGSYDIAGILYFITNIPILLLAYKTLGRELVVKTIVAPFPTPFSTPSSPFPPRRSLTITSPPVCWAASSPAWAAASSSPAVPAAADWILWVCA